MVGEPCFRARPLERADRDLIARGFAALSDESRLLRFGAAKPRLTARELDYLVDVDHHAHEALVAFTCGEGRLMAVGRYVRVPDAPNAAEVAITVGDVWQGRGIGRRLLAELARRAEAEGFAELRASVLPENRRAIRALRATGFTPAGTDGGLLAFALPLGASALPRAA